MRRFTFSGNTTTLLANEHGIWTHGGMFIPWGAVKVFKLSGPRNPTDWLVYSPTHQWGYVSYRSDAFTGYAEQFAGTVESAEVKRSRFGRITTWTFADGREMHYSAQRSLLLTQRGIGDHQRQVRNKLWIETWSKDQDFTRAEESDYELTETEQAQVEAPDNVFSWGEFTRQEPLPPTNYFGIAILVIAAVLGLLFALWTDY